MQVYTNIYKIYKIYTKYPRLGAGPGRRRLAAAWDFEYILYILYIFVYTCIYFDIFWY